MGHFSRLVKYCYRQFQKYFFCIHSTGWEGGGARKSVRSVRKIGSWLRFWKINDKISKTDMGGSFRLRRLCINHETRGCSDIKSSHLLGSWSQIVWEYPNPRHQQSVGSNLTNDKICVQIIMALSYHLLDLRTHTQGPLQSPW